MAARHLPEAGHSLESVTVSAGIRESLSPTKAVEILYTSVFISNRHWVQDTMNAIMTPGF
jgi:hypothetical protein